MENIQSVEGKLLFFINKLYKENIITTFQKNQLKGIPPPTQISCLKGIIPYLQPTKLI
jgi:hypothetical protein